jgi:hypothetical protein
LAVHCVQKYAEQQTAASVFPHVFSESEISFLKSCNYQSVESSCFLGGFSLGGFSSLKSRFPKLGLLFGLVAHFFPRVMQLPRKGDSNASKTTTSQQSVDLSRAHDPESNSRKTTAAAPFVLRIVSQYLKIVFLTYSNLSRRSCPVLSESKAPQNINCE